MKVLLAVLMLGRFLKEVYVTGNESDPRQLFIKQGGEAVLQCLYESERLAWDARKNVNLPRIAIANGKDTVNLTKYKVSTKPSTLVYYRLHVLNSQLSDELIYRCNAGPNIQDFIQLNLYVPPSSLFFNGEMDNKLDGREGTDLLIRCIAVGGNPPPSVSILDGLLGSPPSNAQEVNYKIPKISRDYHQKSIVCQASNNALDSPMKTTVEIYLKLKPLAPIFNRTDVSTKETVPLIVSCTSYGSRPAATFTWTIGGNDVTSSSTTSPPFTESNDTKTVISTLTASVDRNNDKQVIKCQSSNTVGSISATTTLNVTYAPDIMVNSPVYAQNDVIRTVKCDPSGNPDSYTYHKWQHKSKYGEIIREFGGNKTLKLPDAQMLKSYQDSGKYVCTASNGIKGRDNQIEQTGSGYVTVNAIPVFTSDTNNRITQFGEIDKAVTIYVNVYSVPKFASHVWARDGTPITQNLEKYESSSSPTIVRDEFHRKDVQLDGYNVTLTIHDLKAEDFANYTVTLKSGFPDVKFTIVLESATVPEPPGNFSQISSTPTSINVQWDPHSGGGYKQTFYIQYRVQGSLKWSNVPAGVEDVDEQRRRRTYEVKYLKEGTAYELRMYAENTAMKRSNFTEVLTELTRSSDAGSSTGAVIGGVAGSLIGLIIVLLVIVLVLKKRKESATPSTKLRTSSESEDDGLKDNILYEPSQSDGLKKNVLYQSAGPDFESQNKTSTSSEYAVVQKPNAIYAEVNKVAQTKKAKSKKQKDQKEKPKKDRKVKAKAVNNNPEEEYANSALPLQHLNDGEYANSADTQGSSGLNTNKQGLEYADLTFRQIPAKNKKQVIHGNDERTIYADVDHTKKAPPPPQESEYEETNIKHGKIN